MDDAELAEKLKEGDEASFGELYERYALLLYRTAYLILGNRADAEDVLQETLLRCYTHIGELRDKARLKYWLLTIAVRLSRGRGAKNGREYPDAFVDSRLEEKQAKSPPEEETPFGDGSRAAFRTLVGALDRKRREVLTLYYYDELSVKEIAQALGCLEGTVKSRLFSARRLLKEKLLAQPDCV